MKTYEISVNGRRRNVEAADPDTPLLWILRDWLNLTGTKYGCGVGICGACTIHLDGAAARACQVPVSQTAGRKIVTIEGLSADGVSHPCQRAWLAEDVAQCGYCQPGMIMAAAALLAETPRATDGQIDAALSDHVCRCGTFPRIRKAVHAAAGGRTR
jgi:aerobic-type carbon monoxide dehydrogenase small subunit (CoxS/CutS family)